MCNLKLLEIKKANYQDRSLIASSKIKSIEKDSFTSLCGLSPSTSINSLKKLKEVLIKNLNKNKLKYMETKDVSFLNIHQLKLKEFLKYQKEGKENEYLNKKLKLENKPIPNASNIKEVYCIFDKFLTKNQILKVTRQDTSDITPLEVLGIYTRTYQKLYKEQEEYFNSKKAKIGIHESPSGLYKYSIQDLKYNGISTIIIFDTFIVCSFDVDQIPNQEKLFNNKNNINKI